MRLLLLFLIVTLGFTVVNATAVQQPIAIQKVAALQKDTSAISPRKFDDEAIKKYSEQKEFKYDDVEPASPSWFDNFWKRFWRWLDRIFSDETSGGIIKYLLIAVAIALVVFVVIKLAGIDFKLFARKSKTTEVPYEESLENIHEINFDDQIEKAFEAENYRLVVRLLYLKTLKLLSDKELILWEPQKTNQAYVAELAEGKHHDTFAELTYQFEYIWYGEFFIDQKHFQQIQESFTQFNRQAA